LPFPAGMVLEIGSFFLFPEQAMAETSAANTANEINFLFIAGILHKGPEFHKQNLNRLYMHLKRIIVTFFGFLGLIALQNGGLLG
jgi:hypothetical protein